MNWRNEEQYPDRTAAEAMIRVMGPAEDRSALLHDDGCRLLVQAIVRQAVEDHLHALWQSARFGPERLTETEVFFRSGYFRCLTGLNGEAVLRLIRKEADAE